VECFIYQQILVEIDGSAMFRAGLRVGGATFDWYTSHYAIHEDDESLIS